MDNGQLTTDRETDRQTSRKHYAFAACWWQRHKKLHWETSSTTQTVDQWFNNNETTRRHYRAAHVHAVLHRLRYLVVEKHLELESFQVEGLQQPVIHKLAVVLPNTEHRRWYREPLQPIAQTLNSQTKATVSGRQQTCSTAKICLKYELKSKIIINCLLNPVSWQLISISDSGCRR